MLKVMIVDDEPLAHDVLAHLCRDEPDVEIVAHCLNAAEALTKLQKNAVDLLLLDVRMPVFGGLDLLRGLDNPPLAIIVSAYPEHALDGYDLDVVDYLLKPVSAARFRAALDKLRRRIAEGSPQPPAAADDLVLKVDRALRRVRLADIVSLEAQGNFVAVVTEQGSMLATTTLKNLHNALPAGRFVQIHRSFIVNRHKVVEQRSDKVRLSDGRTLPIGRSYGSVRLLD